MALGPQFFPKGKDVEEGQTVSTDATLYHGTGGEIKGGVVRPSTAYYGKAAYATDLLETAEDYARYHGHDQGRLFGTVYEVTPMSDTATHVGSDFIRRGWESGGAVITDTKGLRTVKAVSFPPSRSVYEAPRLEK